MLNVASTADMQILLGSPDAACCKWPQTRTPCPVQHQPSRSCKAAKYGLCRLQAYRMRLSCVRACQLLSSPLWLDCHQYHSSSVSESGERCSCPLGNTIPWGSRYIPARLCRLLYRTSQRGRNTTQICLAASCLGILCSCSCLSGGPGSSCLPRSQGRHWGVLGVV
jgi:hypothetical protein